MLVPLILVEFVIGTNTSIITMSSSIISIAVLLYNDSIIGNVWRYIFVTCSAVRYTLKTLTSLISP